MPMLGEISNGAYDATNQAVRVSNMAAGSSVVKCAKIVASTSGVTSVVTAVTGKKTCPMLRPRCERCCEREVQSSATPTDLTGLEYLGANGGVSSGYSPLGQFETVAGEALTINVTAAVAVGGHLTYVEV